MKIKILQEGKTPLPSGNVGLSLDDDSLFCEGKLLAEMLENRAFEEGLKGFSPYPEEGHAELKISADRPLFPETPHYLRLSALSGGEGAINHAFGGVCLEAGLKYEISFYARSYDFKGFLFVKVAQGGQNILEKKIKLKPDGKWHRFVFRKKAMRSADKGKFSISLSQPGTVHLDWLSLMPLNAIKGLYRRDIFELLKDFKPGFLRFTGDVGLKKTLCDSKHREAEPTKAGFYELLLLSEALCCKPLPVIKLSGEKGEREEVEDLVEFALGGADTEWGSLRAEMGHAQPFPLEYLALKEREEGEDGEDFLKSFAEEMHQKFPKLNLIAPQREVKEKYDHFYAREEVLYQTPEWLFENAHRYDNVPRGRRIVVSYAATERGALSEAAFMTGVEQNADLVFCACRLSMTGSGAYPSLDPLVKVDEKGVYELPGLSVQRLFSLYTGNVLLKTVTDGTEGVYASASEREGLTFLKIVNASDSKLEAEIEGENAPGELNRIVVMREDPVDGSVEPCEIAPSNAKSLSLPPRSFSLVVLRR